MEVRDESGKLLGNLRAPDFRGDVLRLCVLGELELRVSDQPLVSDTVEIEIEFVDFELRRYRRSSSERSWAFCVRDADREKLLGLREFTPL